MRQYDVCGRGHFGNQVWFRCLKLQDKFNFSFPKSQNGSVGRDHWRSCGPSSLPKQGPPEHRVMSTRLLSISREGGSTAWNCCPEDLVYDLTLLTEKNFFLHVSDQSSSEKKFWNIIFNNCFNRHNVDTVQLNFSKALES